MGSRPRTHRSTTQKPEYADGQVAKRSCATCRERRTRCDRTVPACLLCTKSGRHCDGYEIRLSWPTQTNDGRRAIVAKIKVPRGSTPVIKSGHFVRVTAVDIQLYRYLHESAALDDSYREACDRPALGPPMPWHPKTLRRGDADLFSYFQHVAAQSLITLELGGETNLHHVLMRTAFADDSPSSIAVLRALLAVSSLHKNGLNPKALELKTASLGALAAAANTASLKGYTEVMQHVAAAMLLCSFEVYMSSCISEPWPVYICGIKAVLGSSCFAGSQPNSDWVSLLCWVHYHDVLAHFTLRHRRRDHVEQQAERYNTVRDLSPDAYRELYRKTPDSMRILELLIEICQIVKDPGSSGAIDKSTRQRINELDGEIRQNAKTCNDGHPCRSHRIYSLAMLVYLHRGTEDESPDLDSDIEQAFTLLADFPAAKRHFPLFILGCEARSDEQRTIILDLIERSVDKRSARSLWDIRVLLEGVWAQDDLAECRVRYWEKLSEMISRTTIPPSFV